MRLDVSRLVASYFSFVPDPGITSQRVSFGTSGHRGSSFKASFNESHICAIAQAICLYRKQAGINGPLFIGADTHALSEPAFLSALEVFAANAVEIVIDQKRRAIPTPVISRAILVYNKGRKEGLADGLVLSPSHNPPEDGGIKYNPPNGGPADVDVTKQIEKSANQFLVDGLKGVKRIPIASALKAACVHEQDLVTPYVTDLDQVLDMAKIRDSGIHIGIDPLGGAALDFWGAIIDHYKIHATIVNKTVDPTFGFMTVDWDGKVRMDCSSPYAMASLVSMRDKFDIAVANDTDADRHGIVCPSAGLMDPNRYLAASIAYLFTSRPEWAGMTGVGKTVVSSGMIDRITDKLGRRLFEVPVGFKWFSAGLADGSLGFAGEESAGASFLRKDGTVWTTDKDGITLSLLAAEMTAHTGKDPAEFYGDVTEGLGTSYYKRIDAPLSPELRTALNNLQPSTIAAEKLAGEPIISKADKAPGNQQPIGGLKVTAKNGWFAARPSGTEDVYKIYAESFIDQDHLDRILSEAQALVASLK